METTRDERPPEMRGIRMRAARDAFRPFIRVARLNGALQFANLAKPDSFSQTDRDTFVYSDSATDVQAPDYIHGFDAFAFNDAISQDVALLLQQIDQEIVLCCRPIVR